VKRLALLAALILINGGRLLAAPKEELIQEAKRRFQRANALYTEGRYTDALHLYQAAYDLVPSPDILFNLGLTKEKVFDYEGCSLTFRQYLKETTDAARKAQAQERLEHCRVQTLIPVKVSSLPPSAAVLVGDGAAPPEARQARGRTPARLDLKPGFYRITVEAPGYLPQSQEVTVEEGVHPDIDFTLEKLSTLHIEADVSGADVLIDERAEGQTPLQHEIKAGLYHVKLEKAGYRTVTRELRVNPGDQVSLVISLPPLPRERLLKLALDPPAVGEVLLDGERVGAAPLERRVVAGEHRLQVQSAGRVPLDATIAVPDDRDLRLAVHLSARRTRLQRALFWSIESLASCAAAVGLAFGILALDDQSTFATRPTLSLADAGRAHALGSDVAFAVSGAIGLAGAIYYLATWPRRSSTRPLR
jgi:hypothetical protein